MNRNFTPSESKQNSQSASFRSMWRESSVSRALNLSLRVTDAKLSGRSVGLFRCVLAFLKEGVTVCPKEGPKEGPKIRIAEFPYMMFKVSLDLFISLLLHYLVPKEDAFIGHLLVLFLHG